MINMKRTRDEICAAILTALTRESPLGITGIMLHAKLTNAYQAEVYLNRLIAQGHVEVRSALYFITEKGRDWLGLFNKLRKTS